MPRILTAASWLVLLALVAGCAGEDDKRTSRSERTTPSPSSTVSASPSSSAEPVEAPPADDARRALKAAIRSLVEDDTATFHQILGLGSLDRFLMRFDGRYELSTRSAEFTQTSVNPTSGETSSIDFRLLGRTIYLQAAKWPDPIAGCWLATTKRDLVQTLGPRVSNSNLGLTLNIGTLASARGEHFEAGNPDRVVGTVPTTFALQMIAPGLASETDLRKVKGRTYAWFEVGGGELRRWGIDGMEVQQALDEQDLPITPEQRNVFSVVKTEVTYSRRAEPVIVKAPAPSLRMTPAQMESREGCAAS